MTPRTSCRRRSSGLPGAGGGHRNPVIEGESVHGHHQVEHLPAVVGSGAAGDVCRPTVAGAPGDRPGRGRSGGYRATRGHGVHGLPAGAGTAQSGSSGRCSCRMTSSTTDTARSPRSWVSRRTTAGSWRSGHDAGSSTTGHGSRPPAGGARSWPIASWRRWWTVISTLWSPRWPPMWWWSAIAAEPVLAAADPGCREGLPAVAGTGRADQRASHRGAAPV